ncbi:alpha-mannosidase [Paenibacillus bovis]|uniref:Alpha-mannosidase n=1 Tax=Paenibacillus bovis TaxID=1616788 RepID=A0A172ZE67_9BACL|nr:glycoside hydrolase family 38 C-terminal domain-containing protein [Paenibacillus bovis]ANF95935.1 alpha-mannosidase [Paenibacillus bovis]
MHRMERFVKHLAERQWLEQIELTDWTIEEARYITAGRYETLSPRRQSNMTLQGKHGITYLLEAQVLLPASWAEHPAGLLFSAGGGEGLLRVNGEFYHGLDRNHTFVPFRPEHAGQTLQLEIELYDPIPEPHDPLNGQPEKVIPLTGFTASLVSVNAGLRSLIYSLRLLIDSVRRLPEGELRRLHMTEALEQCMDAAYELPEDSWQMEEPWSQLEQLLREQIGQHAPSQENNGRMIMVGQSHIDIAWLWPIRETVRKTSRTFSTMCTLLEQYPEFIYTQSQPQLFAYVKDHYPDLYAKVKAYIAEGRWELVGGMWVEPDLNIPSGESLARQLLYGQRFYREEFGVISTIEWLPDTFGYAASLPQLLRQAGIDYFMTTKLNWNDTNIFPYDLFQWVGIDGTPVLSYLNHGVNESTSVKDIDEHWQSYRQKNIHPEQMLLYGHGDGGGGVTLDMVEYVQHAEMMIGQPQAAFGTAKEFFDHTSEQADELPTWHGDLYLELHRGTYTTQARNKRYNRKAEALYREAEIWERLAAIRLNRSSLPAQTSTTGENEQAVPSRSLATSVASDTADVSAETSSLSANTIDAADYSVSPLIWNGSREAAGPIITAERFREGWTGIMLNQFHDIVPGSAITEVYRTSDVEYEEIMRIGQKALDQALDLWIDALNLSGKGTACVVFNSLGWERGEWIELEGGLELQGIAVYDQAGQRLPSDLVPREMAASSSENTSEPVLRFTAARKRLPGLVPLYSTVNQPFSGSDPGAAEEHVASAKAAGTAAASYLLRVYVPSIPAFGCRVVWLRPQHEEVIEAAHAVHIEVAGEYEHEDDVTGPEDIVLGAAVPPVWETPFYRIAFNERGEISSLYDLRHDRELIQSGHTGNAFGYYHDRPTLWDAWDIDPQFARQSAGKAQLLFSRVIMRGRTGDILRFSWQIGQSEITQDLYLYADHPRIDFKTQVQWRESHKLLKVNFPVDLVAASATYEIPFGALERTMSSNTSWEQAQFEVCGHRWADISEGNYGVSLMNDCKYGYDIKNGHMRLSLLRAPKWPDAEADQGYHEFTYSLLPHSGNWREAHVVRAAMELNQPAPYRIVNRYSISTEWAEQPAAVQENAQAEVQASSSYTSNDRENEQQYTGISLLDYEGGHIILDTIKPAEDGDGTIFRLYESSGSRGKAMIHSGALTFQQPAAEGEWILTNLLEDEREVLSPIDGTLSLTFRPYEIKTLKWKRGSIS